MLEIKARLLAAGVKLAERKGYPNVTRQDIATACGVAAGGVTYHLGDMAKVRRSIVRAGIDAESLPIIAQAVTNGHAYAKDVPQHLRRRAALAAAATN